MTYDIIGDVHGHLDALLAVLAELGYRAERDWKHPDGRTLVFLGDLVDRGPQSLAVVELVRGLVESGRAICLMGNHEFNLLAELCGEREPTTYSQKPAIDREPEAWAAALDFLRVLPVAIELPDLRMVHACWHSRCLERSLSHGPSAPAGATEAVRHLYDHVVVGSPFEGEALREGLAPWGVEGSHERCIEVLMKGVETASRGPIVDAYGVERSLARVSWWTGEWSAAATDKPTVFGHYWHLPPVAEHASTVPVHPLNSGAEDAHRKAMAPQVPARGVWHVPPDQRMICVDFQGVYKGAKRPCVGAYRWPEHEVVWASGVTE